MKSRARNAGADRCGQGRQIHCPSAQLVRSSRRPGAAGSGSRKSTRCRDRYRNPCSSGRTPACLHFAPWRQAARRGRAKRRPRADPRRRSPPPSRRSSMASCMMSSRRSFLTASTARSGGDGSRRISGTHAKPSISVLLGLTANTVAAISARADHPHHVVARRVWPCARSHKGNGARRQQRHREDADAHDSFGPHGKMEARRTTPRPGWRQASRNLFQSASYFLE